MSALKLVISISHQHLQLFAGEQLINVWSVSTGLNGVGEREGSGCTPRGAHTIRACIGAGLPDGAVFIGRRFTGELYTPELGVAFPRRDWILSRILWLSGCEPGVNRLGQVDTMRRYIYIHGTPDSEPMGVPKSHGCIRMRNADLVDLFGQVTPGTSVFIEE